MRLVDAVRTCFGKYARFAGRAARSEYWWFVLFLILGGIVFGVLDQFIFGPDAGLLASLFQLATVIPLLAVGWRRMHDTGRPGWYILIPTLLALSFMVITLGGVFAFGMIESSGADPDALRGPAAFLGTTGTLIAVVVQIVAAVLMLWWLTRPGEPETNEYGPPPTVAGH